LFGDAAILAEVDPEIVNNARDQQKENGTPFLLTLARTESIEQQPAFELMRHYGQMLFSQLWSAPNVWIMFEKNAELLSGFGDLTGDPDVDDWSLETLRLVQNPDLPTGFDPASIPAYSKEGFDRVQKLKLTRMRRNSPRSSMAPDRCNRLRRTSGSI